MRAFTSLFIALFAAGSAVASPTPSGASTLDVWAPPITTPDAETVWQVGKKFEVTWDTSSPPGQITNIKGRVVLQRGCPNAGEVCEDAGTLAEGFPILDGTVEVTVPSTAVPGDDYFIILFGDSGNRSDRFKIEL